MKYRVGVLGMILITMLTSQFWPSTQQARARIQDITTKADHHRRALLLDKPIVVSLDVDVRVGALR